MLFDSPKVISASRRTDLVAWFPDILAEKIESITPEKVHTLVVWTKDHRNMLSHRRLRKVLESLDQVFVHLTVTGLGGTDLEPGVPVSDTILSSLAELVEFCGSPERIRWRFDPIIHWERPDGPMDNLRHFPSLAPRFRSAGIDRAITSICTIYPKVHTRFSNLSPYTPVEPDSDKRTEVRQAIETLADSEGISLSWCCEPGAEPARCIDGNLLNRLHPTGQEAPTEPATGQRPQCGCTRSLDIGWYAQLCRGGCLYCYANPVVRKKISQK